DMNGIYTALQSAVGNEMAAYIIGAKLFGTQQLDANGNPVQKVQVTVTGGGSGGGKGGKGGGGTIIIGGGGKGGGGNQQKVRTGTMDDLIAAVESKLQSASSSGKTVNSVMDLMNTRITLPKQSGGSGGGGGGGGGGKGG